MIYFDTEKSKRYYEKSFYAEPTEEFKLNLFWKLPWNAAQRVLSYLPFRHKMEAFWMVPQLRKSIAENSVVYLTSLSKGSLPKDVETCDILAAYLEYYPNVVPKRVYVVAREFLSAKINLKSFNEIGLRTSYLALNLIYNGDEKQENETEFWQHVTNARELNLRNDHMYGHQIHSVNLKNLESMLSLKTMTISKSGFEWSGFVLPESLEQLTIESCNTMPKKLPSKLKTIILNSCPGSLQLFSQMPLPPSLITISITSCSIRSLNLSDLPHSLLSISICSSHLRDIRFTENACWPSHLEYLDLRDNNLSNDAISAVVGGKLPRGLRTLRLSLYRGSSLQLLQPIPEALELLDISVP